MSDIIQGNSQPEPNQNLIPTSPPVDDRQKQGRNIVLAILSSNLFGLLLAGIYEFLSLRGVVSVEASRLVLCGVWIVGVLIAWVFVWIKHTRKKFLITMLAASLLAFMLLALDRWTPKPSAITAPSSMQPFALQAKAAYVNFAPVTEGTRFWLSYYAVGVNWRSPIPTVVFVSITNKQDIPSRIERIAVKAKTQACDWFDLIPIDSRAGMFSFALDEKLHLAAVIDLTGNSINDVLLGHPISPHESVGGWMLLDTTKECRTFVDESIILKFSLSDAAGVTFDVLESRKLAPDDLHPNRISGDLQKPTFYVTGKRLDISSYREQRYNQRRSLVVIPNVMPTKTPIHWSQTSVPSDSKEWQFKTMLTIQTDETVENPNFKIVCDMSCSFGSFDMGANPVYGTNRSADNKTIEVGLRQSFTPRTPLTVILHSNNAFRVLKADRIY